MSSCCEYFSLLDTIRQKLIPTIPATECLGAGGRIARKKVGKDTFQRKAELDDNIIKFFRGNVEPSHIVNVMK